MTGLGENRSEEATPPITLKGSKPDTFTISSTSAEDPDPFQRLLHALKNSPRSAKQPQLEEMSEDKKPSESRPKVEVAAKEATINQTKKLFLLSYMTDGPGEFWKNEKTDLLLALNSDAEKVSWGDFVEDFKTSFKPLNMALEAQLKLWDLKIKERADEYTYQFLYLAKQTGYNNAVQIVAFKRELPKSLVLKIMT
ncbi:hypothetical protein Moror_3317 [Moniliophthora roreri MCA 2997]|uniref:Retrotransposon gag domain-containing protein n=1 Tax=Moniliophthora roreri (strain MCA 2997) TaxID=1381753 RepID=V2WNP7_MONRO|nr:hypothetical protein Moror_3317 [Moniliophthora roreri MCA 2997]